MNEKLDLKTVFAAVVALVIVGAILIPTLLGSGDDSKNDQSTSSSTSSSTSTGASSPQAGGAAQTTSPVSASATDSSETSASPTAVSSSLTGQAADEAVLRDVVPKWGTFDLADAQSPESWADRFSENDGVTTKFSLKSKNRYEDLWSGALQQGVNVTACKIVSIKKGATHGSTTSYDVTTQHTMVSADSSVKGLDGTYEQQWSFDVKHEPGEAPQLDDFTDKTAN